MALLASASNFGAGTPLTIAVGVPSGSGIIFAPAAIDYVSYHIVNGTGSGTLTFYGLGTDGVYRALASPAPVTLASGDGSHNGGFGGVSQGPFLGVQVLAAITGTVTYGQLLGTTRP